MSAIGSTGPFGFWQTLRERLPSGRQWRSPRPRPAGPADGKGHVYLIGCGPGDPELLTLKAARLIGQADVVFYDRLVDPAVVALAPKKAKRVYVGKQCAHHGVDQETIERLLVTEALRGGRVMRLKGGDPFIFGRGGEELLACRRAGLPCTVVPGVTAALGCAAESALPLTFRGIARSVTFATAHTVAGPALDSTFAPLLTAGHTLAVYMGRRTLGDLAARLRSLGVAGDLPVALVLDGTTARQRTLRGTLAMLPDGSSVEDDAAGLVLIGHAIAAAETPATLAAAEV